MNDLTIVSSQTRGSVRKARVEKCRADIEAAIRSRRDLHASLVVLSDICMANKHVGDNARRGAQYTGLRKRSRDEIVIAEEALRLLSELESSINDAMSSQNNVPRPFIEEQLEVFESCAPQWLRLTEPLMEAIRAVVPKCL